MDHAVQDAGRGALAERRGVRIESMRTVVDVRLEFEAGEAMLFVRFDRDGKVIGLFIRPPQS